MSKHAPNGLHKIPAKKGDVVISNLHKSFPGLTLRVEALEAIKSGNDPINGFVEVLSIGDKSKYAEELLPYTPEHRSDSTGLGLNQNGAIPAGQLLRKVTEAYSERTGKQFTTKGMCFLNAGDLIVESEATPEQLARLEGRNPNFVVTNEILEPLEL